MEGRVIEEIRNFLEWGGGTMVFLTTRLGVVCLAAAVLILAAAFF
jgi:hypothetical protein